MRKSGILLPVSGIPSKYGIGTFGRKAYEFIDFLKKGGQSYWQILPLGPTGYGDSPYQSFSTFAGNPYYIDLDMLIEEGLLTQKQVDSYEFCDTRQYVDYEKIYNARFEILHKAYQKSNLDKDVQYQDFCRQNQYWLEDYALFMAIKNKAFGGKSFSEWDEDIKTRQKSALVSYAGKYEDEINFYKFQQYYFKKQWLALKKYAGENGIEIIGDIPIYVAFDSADTWANPELFQFDRTMTPVAVAGCPPDAFSETGQLWGNPLYNWEYHKKTEYVWWKRRIEYCYELYDVVRIDHFRGFDEYYAIPYGDTTAEFGRWEPGPGYDLFEKIMAKKSTDKKAGKKIIAEDLGFLTNSVRRLVRKSGFPGMKVLQFAFDSREESDYLPHNYPNNCIVYTGTHDNDTSIGWWNTLRKSDKAYAKKYMNVKTGRDINWIMIRTCMESVADTVIVPMQDYLSLGSQARINIPSTLGVNWKWRMSDEDINLELAEKIYDLTKTYCRC